MAAAAPMTAATPAPCALLLGRSPARQPAPPALSPARRAAQRAVRPLRPCAASSSAAQPQAAGAANGGSVLEPLSPGASLVVGTLGLVRSKWQLFTLLRLGVATGKVPERLLSSLDDLYTNYSNAVVGSGVPGATDAYVAQVMAGVVAQSLVQFMQPFTFQSHHRRILEPYNHYDFGQTYTRGLVDFNSSLLGHADLFKQVQQQLDAGENVVLLANHQTEADPAVFALLLEALFPRMATDVIYVAGDRVVTDPLCKPFSMGRNLFCVHSKKHLDDYPELKADKMAMNRRTLKAMQQALNEGGKLLWIAPSGGRDRRKDPATGESLPDDFDPSAVELMRALLAKAKPKGHIYPFAMYSWKIMPPPASLEKAVGEKRLTNYAPCGVSICPELDTDTILEGVEDKEARQQKLSDAAFHAVDACYRDLVKAIRDPSARGSSYTQPWLARPQKPLSYP